MYISLMFPICCQFIFTHTHPHTHTRTPSHTHTYTHLFKITQHRPQTDARKNRETERQTNKQRKNTNR